MAKQLTLKQREFIREYTDPQSENAGIATRAALAVYDTDSYTVAGSIASENLQKLKIRVAIEAAWAAHNLTPNRLAAKLDRKLEATRTIVTANPATGEVTKTEVEDHGIQLRAVELTAKLMDAFPQRARKNGAEKLRSIHRHQHLHLRSDEDLERIAAGRLVPSGEDRVVKVQENQPGDTTIAVNYSKIKT